MKLESFYERLLDLSKSNRLINFKEQKYTTLEVKLPDMDELFNMLFLGNSLEVYDIDKFVLQINDHTFEGDIPFLDMYHHFKEKVKSKNIVLYKNNGSVNSVLKTLKKKIK